MSFLVPSTFASSFQSNASNLSFFAVPAAYVLAIVPHMYAISLTKGKFTNCSPREYTASIAAKQTKTSEDKKFLRAEAAQSNGFENLALFAAAVVAGNFAGIPAGELNALAAGYLVSRAAFNWLYIFVEDEATSFLRSGAYFAGIGMVWTFFIKAGYRAM